MKAHEARTEADIKHHRRITGSIREAATDGRYLAQIMHLPQRVAMEAAGDLRDDGYTVSMTEVGKPGELDEGRVTLRVSW